MFHLLTSFKPYYFPLWKQQPQTHVLCIAKAFNKFIQTFHYSNPGLYDRLSQFLFIWSQLTYNCMCSDFSYTSSLDVLKKLMQLEWRRMTHGLIMLRWSVLFSNVDLSYFFTLDKLSYSFSIQISHLDLPLDSLFNLTMKLAVLQTLQWFLNQHVFFIGRWGEMDEIEESQNHGVWNHLRSHSVNFIFPAMKHLSSSYLKISSKEEHIVPWGKPFHYNIT